MLGPKVREAIAKGNAEGFGPARDRHSASQHDNQERAKGYRQGNRPQEGAGAEPLLQSRNSLQQGQVSGFLRREVGLELRNFRPQNKPLLDRTEGDHNENCCCLIGEDLGVLLGQAFLYELLAEVVDEGLETGAGLFWSGSGHDLPCLPYKIAHPRGHGSSPLIVLLPAQAGEDIRDQRLDQIVGGFAGGKGGDES